MVAVIFFIVDFFLYFISVSIGYKLRDVLCKSFPFLPPFIIPFDFILSQIWIPAVFFFSFLYSGLYTKVRDFWSDLEAILKSFSFSIILIFSIISFIKFSDRLSRLHIILSISIFFLFYPAVRYLLKIILNKIGWGIKSVLILGITKGSISLARFIKKDHYLSYQIIGFWDKDYKEPKFTVDKNIKLRVFRIKNIEGLLKKLRPDALILSETYFDSTFFIAKLRRYVKNLIFIPNGNPFFIYNSFLISTPYSNSLVFYLKNNLREPMNIFIKRLFDIVVSVTLIILLLPLMAVISILIKLSSPGPLIFSHTREGKDKKKIKIYKFRTMYINSEELLNEYLKKNPEAKEAWKKYRKIKNDPRITRIGKFLRKTSLDELPQLFNILKGEMSLVGPRPVTKEEIQKYYKEFASFYYEVKPGLTGLWQVSGKNRLSYEQRVFLDVMYVLNWSIWRDIIILAKTLPVIFQNED